jgi:hypothetical protein
MKALSLQLSRLFRPHFFRNLLVAAAVIALMCALLYVLINSPA